MTIHNISSDMSDDQIWDAFEELHQVAENRGWMMRAFSHEQMTDHWPDLRPSEVWDQMFEAVRDG
jgi:hypothetical protein